MSVVSRTTAKTYFETGDYPTQAQFENLIESTLFPGDPLFYKSDMWTDFPNNIGTKIPLQPHLMTKRICMLIPAPDGTTPTLIGMSAISTTGTITNPDAFSEASYRTQAVRLLYRSAGTAGSTAHWRSNNQGFFWRGDAANRGGFTVSFNFSIPSQPAGYIFFTGLRASSAAIGATTESSTLISCAAIGKDSTDTNLQFMHNDNVGNCTKEDTGLTPATDTIYKLIIHCESGGSTIYFVLVDLQDLTVKDTYSAVANLPLNAGSGAIMRPFHHISNNATATAVDCESGGFYGEAFN